MFLELLEIAAVRQAGEGIVVGQVGQFVLGAEARPHVVDHESGRAQRHHVEYMGHCAHAGIAFQRQRNDGAAGNRAERQEKIAAGRFYSVSSERIQNS